MIIDASKLQYDELNTVLRMRDGDCELVGCLGQRFIGAGMGGRRIDIHGTPGNALGAYLNGAHIEVFGNTQDAVGDTMNAGSIIVHGSIGDTAGYAMRGGEIIVEGSAGYRAGVHMKEYAERVPVMVIGGRAGSFLGEYQAGGLIIVLGLHADGGRIVGNFPCTGMHGGRVFLRSDCKGIEFPKQVTTHTATQEDIDSVRCHIERYCRCFGQDIDDILASGFTVVTPDSKNPYRQMYVAN